MAFSEDTKVGWLSSCSGSCSQSPHHSPSLFFTVASARGLAMDWQQERLIKVVDITKTVLHYGWVPFVLYVGFTRSTPQPSLIKLISPLA
ncbi:hypothetical protein ACQY0O_000221 [Thecaphora frezii]